MNLTSTPATSLTTMAGVWASAGSAASILCQPGVIRCIARVVILVQSAGVLTLTALSTTRGVQRRELTTNQIKDMNTIKIKQEICVHPTGRVYIRFIPYLETDCLANGQLTFAVYECWQDEPDKFELSKSNALRNAVKALNLIVTEATRTT